MSDDDALQDDIWDIEAVVIDAMCQAGYFNAPGTTVELPLAAPPKRRGFFLRPKQIRPPLDFRHVGDGGVAVGGDGADWWFSGKDGLVDSAFDPTTLTPEQIKRAQEEDEEMLLWDLLYSRGPTRSTCAPVYAGEPARRAPAGRSRSRAWCAPSCARQAGPATESNRAARRAPWRSCKGMNAPTRQGG